MSHKARLQIAIVDDHQVLIDTLRYVLGMEPDMELIGAANDLESARHLLNKVSADIVLIEVQLPDGDGFDLITLIRQASPETRIVILTTTLDDTTILRALHHEVDGYLTKACSLDELLSTLRAVANGETSIASNLLIKVLKRQPWKKVVFEDSNHAWECLTCREMEVLNCLALGKSGGTIAMELHITPFTVRTHIRNLMSKLGAHTRLEAVSFALSRGMIQTPRG
jgi:two-component system, NarL family, nitrate/nitrite response regulator NarL